VEGEDTLTVPDPDAPGETPGETDAMPEMPLVVAVPVPERDGRPVPVRAAKAARSAAVIVDTLIGAEGL
jgi:hypothetical protein